MDFWLPAGVITALVVATMVVAAMARRGNRPTSGNDIQVYRDQLTEVDRDFARGVLNEQEAERLRLEVSRRLLDADRQRQLEGTGPLASSSPLLAAGIAVLVTGGAYLLYLDLGQPGQRDLPLETRLAMSEETRLNRISQAQAEAEVTPVQPTPSDPAHLDLMQKLREALKSRPDDLQGHQLLAQNEAGLGDFAAAHRAQQNVIRIKGSQATADDYANYADLLALAANGYISPEAEAAVRKTLTLDPTNGSGRYYLGLMNAQIGRSDLALDIWRQLLQDSAPAAPWVAPIRARIEFLAADAGVRFELPQLAPGPTAQDIEAAQELSPEQQDDMIRGMVSQLSERLATEGGNAQEWARLIGALGVLGETSRAEAIWQESQAVFASDPTALARLREAAVSAGVAE